MSATVRAQMVGGPQDGQLWEVQASVTRLRFPEPTGSPARHFVIERAEWSELYSAWRYPGKRHGAYYRDRLIEWAEPEAPGVGSTEAQPVS